MNRELVKNYLMENPETALYIAQDVHAWDGRFEELDTYNGINEILELWNMDDVDEIRRLLDYVVDEVRAKEGAVDMDGLFRFNAYGLEAVTEEDIYDEIKNYYMDDIIDALEEFYPAHIDVSDEELLKLLND